MQTLLQGNVATQKSQAPAVVQYIKAIRHHAATMKMSRGTVLLPSDLNSAWLVLQLLKFSGCYHGHADSFLVQAGSAVATLGLPDSPGVPAASTGTRSVTCANIVTKA